MAIQNAKVIKNSVLFRCGELTDGTSAYDSKALEYINQIYRSILSGGNEFNLDLGKPWVWAKARTPGTLVLQTEYSGTAAVVNGSTSVTLSAAPAVSLKGQYFRVLDGGDFYKVLSHSGTSVTLDAAYTSSTNAAASFKVYFLEYDLPQEIERLVGPMVVDKQQDFNAPMDGLIYGVDMSNINESYPLKFIRGSIPTNFAQISRGANNKIRVRFNDQAGSQTRVSFDYIPTYSDLAILSCQADGTGYNLSTAEPHGLKVDQAVCFTDVAASLETIYYVTSTPTKTSFTVSATLGGLNYGITPGAYCEIVSVPVLPPAFAQILDYGASFYLLTDKNDERAQQYYQLAAQKMQAMIDANSREMSQTGGVRYSGMIPRLDMFSGPRRYWRQSSN